MTAEGGDVMADGYRRCGSCATIVAEAETHCFRCGQLLTPTPRHTEHTRCSPTCDLAGMCVDCGQPWPCATESVRRQSYA